MKSFDGRSRLRMAWGFLVGGLVCSLGVSGPIRCPFRRVTGVPCPFCGSSRAFRFLRRGQIGKALRDNPLTCLLTGVALWIVVQGERPERLHHGHSVLRSANLPFIRDPEPPSR